MKKNISINISGIIFHVEEDGYEKLKSYLGSVSRYFSTYEDSKEIIEDIENRIAEIFFSKMSTGKQVISLEDIDDLIAKMGTVADFELEDGAEEATFAQEETKESSEEQTKQTTDPGKRKLYRDTQRKVLGGVASGIAHYFNIDPIWIRLFILLAFINVFFGGLSGIVFITYIVLWIVVPANPVLEDDRKIKKIFRNSEDKVLGGVAGGLAAYFGTDTTVIRLLFVLSIFLGGTGIILYIILWIITPQARTITEKMQMKGDPVTLSNIEDNVKKSLNVKDEDENPVVKILLFPFRLIALLISAIGNLLGPFMKVIVDVLRIFAGAMILLIGVGFVLASLSFLFIAMGVFSGWTNFFVASDLPLSMLQTIVTPWATGFLFLGGIIPAIAIMLGGIAIMLRRSVVNSTVSWAMFGLWLISVIGISFTVPPLIMDWTSDGDYRAHQTYQIAPKTAVLKINENGEYDFTKVSLKLRGHSDTVYLLDRRFEARGNSRNDAIDNAKKIAYNVTQQDSVLVFDTHFTFDEGVTYRAQQLDLTLFIPEGAVFSMDESIAKILRNTLYKDGYRTYHLQDNLWTFEAGALNCLTCDEVKTYRPSSKSKSKRKKVYGNHETFNFSDFQSISASAYYDIEISQGENYSVVVDAPKRMLNKVSATQRGDEVIFELQNDSWIPFSNNKSSRVNVSITMPELQNLTLSGASKADISGFDQLNMRLDVSGASNADIYANIAEMQLAISGASTVTLSGEGQDLEAYLSGASKLRAYQYSVDYADVEASGASSAEVYVNQILKADATGVSKIKHRGDARVDGNANSNSSIKRGY